MSEQLLETGQSESERTEAKRARLAKDEERVRDELALIDHVVEQEGHPFSSTGELTTAGKHLVDWSRGKGADTETAGLATLKLDEMSHREGIDPSMAEDAAYAEKPHREAAAGYTALAQEAHKLPWSGETKVGPIQLQETPYVLSPSAAEHAHEIHEKEVKKAKRNMGLVARIMSRFSPGAKSKLNKVYVGDIEASARQEAQKAREAASKASDEVLWIRR